MQNIDTPFHHAMATASPNPLFFKRNISQQTTMKYFRLVIVFNSSAAYLNNEECSYRLGKYVYKLESEAKICFV
jgi:hypothetical protein